MIQFIIKDYEGVIDELLGALQKRVLQYWPHGHVAFISCTDYWKFEGDKVIIFGIALYPRLSVQDVIKIFNVTWDYSEGNVYNVETNKKYSHESAVWSQLCNPMEVFLIPQVDWVHIYTWPESGNG
jgi:hypothetical protein